MWCVTKLLRDALDNIVRTCLGSSDGNLARDGDGIVALEQCMASVPVVAAVGAARWIVVRTNRRTLSAPSVRHFCSNGVTGNGLPACWALCTRS